MKKMAPQTKKETPRKKVVPSKKAPKKTVKKTVAPKPPREPLDKLIKKNKPLLVPLVRILVRAFDYTVVDEASKLIVETAERGGSMVSGPVLLPTKIKKYTVNRSFFVHKDARDQYEIRTHKRLIDIKEPTPQTIEALQNLSLPAGVDVEIKMLQK